MAQSSLRETISSSIRILLVEDNPGDARLVGEEIRANGGSSRFHLTHVAKLNDALQRLGEQSFDAVLLDLGLPDAHGLDAVTPISEAAPGLPIVVLSGVRDRTLAVQAVKRGAQDYLVKGQGDGNLLTRSILYAIERKRSEQHIRHLAHYDGLTNVPNRRLLYDRLRQALARARRGKHMVALLFLDLDHFKNINDTLGHSVGDLLLQGVAGRLNSCTRDSDTIARLGGDEFALVVSEIMRLENVSLLADKILEALRPAFPIEGHDLCLSASMGISLYPIDGMDAETLLKNADIAMYGAKQKGGNNYQLYSPPMNARASERLTLAISLRHALERDEFILHYQPQIDLRSGTMVGVEALIRWQSPSWGLMGPGQFIPLAEETGLIVPIGEWVIRRACDQARLWRDAGLERLRVAVNLSGRQFNRDDLPATVEKILESSGLPPSLLELELTENGIMQSIDSAAQTLQKLKAAGVRIAIDDFGTGYSSLSCLKRFPIDTIKIDQSFVRDVSTDRNDAAIGTAIIAMAHGLGLDVVAEGVETPEQLVFLRRHQCDKAQGFYFSSPLTGQALEECMKRGGRWGEGMVHSMRGAAGG